ENSHGSDEHDSSHDRGALGRLEDDFPVRALPDQNALGSTPSSSRRGFRFCFEIEADLDPSAYGPVFHEIAARPHTLLEQLQRFEFRELAHRRGHVDAQVPRDFACGRPAGPVEFTKEIDAVFPRERGHHFASLFEVRGLNEVLFVLQVADWASSIYT